MLQIFKGKNFTQQIFKVQTAVCVYFIMQSQRSDSRQTLQACVMWLVSWRVTRCPHLIRCHLFCCSVPLMLLLLCVVNADLLLLCTLTATLLVFCNPTTSPAATSRLCFSDLLQSLLFIPVMSVKQIIFGQYLDWDAAWRQICFKLLRLLLWLYMIDK